MHSGIIPSDSRVVSYKISSNGKAIPDESRLYSIAIDQYLLSKDMAVITLADGDAANKAFNVSSAKTFAPGALIEISLGYDNDLQSVYKGVVSKQIIDINQTVGSVLKVVCQTFNPLGTKPIKPIITLAGLAAPELVISYGNNLLELEMELDTKHQSSILTKYRGALNIQGTTTIKVNSLISLKGLGDRFSGDVYISGVSHDVSEGNWVTTAYLGISDRKLQKYKPKSS